jgi:signal transduction histidine kinase
MRTPPWNLAVKLGLVLFLLVAGAIGIVYATIVPRLESRLVDTTVSELRQASELQAELFRGLGNLEQSQELARALDSQVNARVAVLGELSATTLVPLADSRSPLTAKDLVNNPIALEAAESNAPASGRTIREGQEYAEVARPIGPDAVLLLSAPLSDQLSAVDVVRRDILLFGGVALAASWLVGAFAALKFAGRIRRLEVAADRIAGGDFVAPVVDTGRDEVAELARSFDRMRQRLAQLDSARREFIANASHELRTPLFAIGGFLELLADEDLDEATRRDFRDSARGQVERLTRLAGDLLDLSRLDADQVGLASEPVDLADMAARLAEEFGPVAESGDHALSVVVPDEVMAMGDAERILRIGRSLVENALRHTPVGTSIEVRAGIWVDRAELSVHDDGPGVPDEEQERVFDRFYRGEHSSPEGSGIGLAIARELAQRMGGAIELRSEPGSTTFTLVLKRAPATATFSRENALV